MDINCCNCCDFLGSPRAGKGKQQKFGWGMGETGDVLGPCQGQKLFHWASPCGTCAIRVPVGTAALFGAWISPWLQAVTLERPGRAGDGLGTGRDSLGCARRKWLGASAVAMCTLKGRAQRLPLGSLLGESRWDFLFAPFPAPSPSSCLGPFGLQPRQRLSNPLPALLMLGAPILGLSTPILVLSTPVPVLSPPGAGGTGQFPCASQIQGQSRRALGADRERMAQVH